MTTLQLQGEVQQNQVADLREIYENCQQNIPRDQIIQVKLPLSSKHSCLDFVSNLEFSSHFQEKNLSNSFISSADANNITPQKILVDTNPKRNPPKQAIRTGGNSSKSDNIQENSKFDERTPSFEANNIHSLFLYKVWPSKNSFYFNGRIMTGPKSDRVSNLIAWLLILIPSFIYFGVAFRYLLEDVPIIMPFISIYLLICTVIFFLLTSFTDPGIIPRKNIWEVNGEVPSPYNGETKSQRATDNDIVQINVNVSNNKSLSRQNSFRYCQICQIYKPRRTVHCNYCGNCVEVFDRHCHFMRNCIGKRNYKYFVGFIASLILLSICYVGDFLMIMIIFAGCDPDVDPSYFFKTNTVTLIIVIILGIPSAIILLIMIFLIFYHYKLFRKNLSENQDCHGKENELVRNFLSWSITGTSLFNSRQQLTQKQFLRLQDCLIKEIL